MKKLLFVITLFCLCAATAWSTDVTLRLVDQNGILIPASQFQIGPTYFGQGETVTLSPGSYSILVLPGLDGRVQGGDLYRFEDATISGSNQTLTFIWKLAPLTLNLVDQTNAPIAGSVFGIPGANDFRPNGVTLVLPVTSDPAARPSMGPFASGYAAVTYPGIDGREQHGDLYRWDANLVLTEGGNTHTLLWSQLECQLSLVDVGGVEIPSSRIALAGLNISNGDVIRLPMTDETVHPSMVGSYKDGYPIELYPSDTYVGTATFEVSGSLEFSPSFVTLDGNQYGIRCGSPVGSISGKVSANCPQQNNNDDDSDNDDEGEDDDEPHTVSNPAPNGNLYGVSVDLYNALTGDLLATTTTDTSGSYHFSDLSAGNYLITIQSPLGYSTSSSEKAVTLCCGNAATVNFEFACSNVSGSPRGIGFWKHQFSVATGGKGSTQISVATLCNYLDVVQTHFNDHAVNPVVVYQPPVSNTCTDKLNAGNAVINTKGSVPKIAKARQQLLALLLNVVAGFIHQAFIISEDGATVAQAITYCDTLIDNPFGNYELAKEIAEEINEGESVDAGKIPLATPDVRYKTVMNMMNALPTEFSLEQNYPNPFNPVTTFRYQLPTDSRITLRIYNVLGQVVKTIIDDVQPAGYKSIDWDASKVASGVYFYKLEANSIVDPGKTFTQVKKMLMIK